MRSTPHAAQDSRALPVRVSPIEPMHHEFGESFMSWATQLAWSNGYRSIQRLLVAEGLPAACASSDAGQEESRKRFIRLAGFDDSLSEYLRVRIFPTSSNDLQPRAGPGSRWILHRDTVEPGTPHQVCPQCLAACEVPYWTLNSRRSYVTQCTRHDAVLLSHCPECANQLTISKTRNVELHQCAVCRFDLRSAHQSAISPSDQVPRHWTDLTAVIPHPCARGFIKKYAFWAGIKLIFDVVFRHSIAVQLLKVPAIGSFHGLIEKIVDRPQWCFDHHDVGVRHQALLFMKWLMQEWDERMGAIQSAVDVRTPIKYLNANSLTWPQEYFRDCTMAAYVPLEVRYARTLLSSA